MIPVPPAPAPSDEPVETPISFTCWCCKTALTVPVACAGQEIACPQCHQTIVAPEAGFAPHIEPSARRRISGKLVAAIAAVTIVVVGVSLWGVQKWQKTKKRNETYPFRVSHSAFLGMKKYKMPVVALRVVSKADRTRVIHTWARFDGSSTISISRNTPTSDIVVQVETPEGWMDCPTKHEMIGGENVNTMSFGLAQLWVDNLGGAKTDLACGEFRFPIAADSKANFAFPGPLIKAVPIKLGERDIGDMPPLQTKENDFLSGRAEYLVDCSGKRRYRYESVVYKETNKLPARFNFQGSAQQFAGKHLHHLPSYEVDYFLEQAPPTLIIETFGPNFRLEGEQRLRFMLVRE